MINKSIKTEHESKKPNQKYYLNFTPKSKNNGKQKAREI
jgi:hypothetical protein